MALPDLRHFENRGIFHIYSDSVEALVGEAWVLAIYTDKGWATADGGKLVIVDEWRLPCLNTPAPPNPRSPRQRKRVARSK
jgi:hypothetical protein